MLKFKCQFNLDGQGQGHQFLNLSETYYLDDQTELKFDW